MSDTRAARLIQQAEQTIKNFEDGKSTLTETISKLEYVFDRAGRLVDSVSRSAIAFSSEGLWKYRHIEEPAKGLKNAVNFVRAALQPALEGAE